jgi:hypothetical protein
MIEFIEFTKIARLSRNIVVTEKIDGTNSTIFIGEDGEFLTGSRTRWITPENDNYGFARWAQEHKDELMKLGPGWHRGEWWGGGCQRGYGFKKGEKFFSLFNTSIWCDDSKRPACCSVVPVLYTGIFDTVKIQECIDSLGMEGSRAAPGFKPAEGVVIYHTAGNVYFKKTILKDDEHKGEQR